MKLLFDVSGSANTAQDGWTKFRVYDRDFYNATATRGVKEAVQKLALSNTVGPMIWDIERWHVETYSQQLVEIVDWAREVRPDLRQGFYSLLPARNYWGPVLQFLGQTPNSYNSWMDENKRLARRMDVDGKVVSRGLVDAVDFVCPSLYTFYSNADAPPWKHEDYWHEFAKATISEARKYQKPVYPFVMPRYHPSVHPNTEPLSVAFFNAQIETCLTHADGVCIWDDGGQKLKFDAEQTMRAIAAKNATGEFE